LAKSWNEKNSFAEDGQKKFGQFLTDLAPYVPGLFQQKPSDAPPLPKPWIDPVTGEQLPNPWLKASLNLDWQALLTQKDPALAEHYKAMAKNSYAYVAKLQDDAAARLQAQAIKYDKESHATNPFVTGAMTEASQLILVNPELGDFMKSEAKPLVLPWLLSGGNLTQVSRITAADPAWGALVARATEILRIWISEAHAFAKTELERAKATVKDMETQLSGERYQSRENAPY
jgi:hypothetical protein